MICRLLLFFLLFLPLPLLAANNVVTGLRVVNDRWPDAGSPETFGRDAIRLAGAQDSEDQAIAVWRFIQKMTEVGTVPKEPAYGNLYVLSPEKQFNVYGVHWCDGLTRLMTSAWRALGQRADKLYKFGHTLADIHYLDRDGVDRWHVFDLSQHWFVYDRTGKHIATASELSLDHSLLYYPSATPVPDKPSPLQPSWVHAGHLMPKPHPMGLKLGVGDRIEFLFGNEGKPYMNLFPPGNRRDFEHGPYPITYGNGQLITRHISDKIMSGKAFVVELPYIISDVFMDLSGKIEKPGGFLKVSLSTDGGHLWQVLWSTKQNETGSFNVQKLDICTSFDPETLQQVESVTPFGRYDYMLKVDSEGVDLENLQTMTVFQHNFFALPMLWPGNNGISVKGLASQGTGVRVTYRWDDAEGLQKEDARLLKSLPADYNVVALGERWEDVRCRSLKIEAIEMREETDSTEPQMEDLNKLLANTLSYPTVRSIGAKASREPRFDRDAAELKVALESKDRSVIADRIVALGALQDARSADILEKVIFQDDSQPVWHKILACQALYQSIGKNAVPIMIRVFENDPRIVWASPQGKWSVDAMWLHTAAVAAAILADIKDFNGKERVADLITATLRNERTVRPLKEIYRGNEIIWGLIRDLGTLGGERHIPLLAGYLRANEDAATVAAEALIKIGSESLLPNFLALVDEAEYPPLRIAAIKGVGQFGQPQHGKALYPFLADRDEAFRGAAAWALGHLRDPGAVVPLQQAIRIEPFPWVQKIMQESLDHLNHVIGDARTAN